MLFTHLETTMCVEQIQCKPQSIFRDQQRKNMAEQIKTDASTWSVFLW